MIEAGREGGGIGEAGNRCGRRAVRRASVAKLTAYPQDVASPAGGRGVGLEYAAVDIARCNGPLHRRGPRPLPVWAVRW